MIASPNHSGRGGARVRLVVIHTAEGATTTGALGRYFARKDVGASSHVGIDDHGVEQYVPYDRAAWTLRSGNPISDNAELCAFARWSREEWLRHRPMLEKAAAWTRERCQARGIPMVKLSPAQVRAGQAGVIGHHDWTVGMKDGTHTDPGSSFPWDLFMELVQKGVISLSWDAEYAPINDPKTVRPMWRWNIEGATNSWDAKLASERVQHYFEEQLQTRYVDPETGQRSEHTDTAVGYILGIDAHVYTLLVEWQKERDAQAAHREKVEAALTAIQAQLGQAAP